VQVNGRAIANLGTGVVTAINKTEQRTYFVQSEAQFPASSDEAQASLM
jgi:hypothetical protein